MGILGFGTATPGYKLDVSGSGRYTGALQLDTQATATNQAVAAGRTITSGTGLSGGGDLTANRTLSLDYSNVGRAVSKTVNVPNGVAATTYYDLFSIVRSEPSATYFVTLSMAGTGNGSTRTYVVPANWDADGNCGASKCGSSTNWVEVAATSASTRAGGAADQLDLLVNINSNTISFRAFIPVVNSSLNTNGATLYVGISDPSNDTFSNGTVTNLATTGTMTAPTTYLPVSLAGTGGQVGIGTASPISGAELDVQGGSINTSGTIMTGGTARIDASGNLVAIGNITGAGSVAINGTGAGTISIGGTSTGDIAIGGGSGSTGCTVTNATGVFACTSTLQGTQLLSTVATGTAPLTVTSTTKVTNLNADTLDGIDSDGLRGCHWRRGLHPEPDRFAASCRI